MPYLEWNSSLETGNRVIDECNRELFDMLRELHASFARGDDRSVAEDVLIRLMAHTTSHFSREEELMAETGYHDTFAHRLSHNELRLEATEMELRFIAGEEVEPLEVLSFLHNKLQAHILDHDQRMAAYLRERSSSPLDPMDRVLSA